MKVMFIDDAPEVIDGMRRSFRKMRDDWEMSFFEDPTEALEVLRANPDHIVVADWMMPRMTGIELCAAIRNFPGDQTGSRYYVIILTGKQEVSAVVEALDAGADDFVRKPYESMELGARIRTGARLIDSTIQLREATQRLVELANTDALTGLVSRLRGNEILENEIARASRGVASLLVAMVDIDHFKRVNDSHGHGAGDEVLKEISRRLCKDRRNYDAVVRWGGEEFLVILPHASNLDASSIGERLRHEIALEPVVLKSGVSLEITASVGLATTMNEREIRAVDLLEKADQALYGAKNAGRDQYVIFDELNA